MMFYDMRKLLSKIVTNRLFLHSIIVSSLFMWAIGTNSCSSQATDAALNALSSDNAINVEVTTNFIAFRQRSPAKAPEIGFIFYPGGLVDARAYAPLCRTIAEAGFFVVITPVPFNLAVFNPFVGQPIIQEMRFVRTWVIGGHSLGGAMAARFVYEDSTRCKGLVLYASYPDVSNDLSNRSVRTLSISASLDGLATPSTIDRNKQYLPPVPQTRYVVLEGGNHAQFGNYGKQNRDNDATISAQEQQRITADETIRFLNSLQ